MKYDDPCDYDMCCKDCKYEICLSQGTILYACSEEHVVALIREWAKTDDPVHSITDLDTLKG